MGMSIGSLLQNPQLLQQLQQGQYAQPYTGASINASNAAVNGNSAGSILGNAILAYKYGNRAQAAQQQGAQGVSTVLGGLGGDGGASQDPWSGAGSSMSAGPNASPMPSAAAAAPQAMPATAGSGSGAGMGMLGGMMGGGMGGMGGGSSGQNSYMPAHVGGNAAHLAGGAQVGFTGPTATHPETGARVAFRNGQWMQIA